MGAVTQIRGQLLGYKTLPEQGGLWGLLLPKPGDKAVAHEPDAQDVVQSLDDNCLVFGASSEVGNRGFFFAFCLPFSFVPLQMVPLFLRIGDAPWHLIAFAWTVLSLFAVIPIVTAYRSARSPLPPAIYLSRPLRKLFVWQRDTKTWLGLAYDTLVPATFVNRAATPSGAFTTYVLRLQQLKPGTREIEFSVAPAPAQGLPEQCGALWEFIRRYMDGRPEVLPPIRLLPANDHPNAWMVRTDRTIFSPFIDAEHRVRSQHIIFAHCVVYFWGSLGYWWERAAGWIERTAPRVPLPNELQATLSATPTQTYRTIAPTEVQVLARQGLLPHMRQRWRICGVAGTLFWVWLFGLVTAGIWVRM